MVSREGRAEESEDDSLDELSPEDGSSSSGEESGPDIKLIQQRRGKKRVLSESPIKASDRDHLERSFSGKKSREKHAAGIADARIIVLVHVYVNSVALHGSYMLLAGCMLEGYDVGVDTRSRWKYVAI